MPQDLNELSKPIGSNFDHDSVIAALEAEPEDDDTGNALPARATTSEKPVDDATRNSRFLEEEPAIEKPQGEDEPSEPVIPAPGNEQQVDEGGNPIGPVPYERFKEINEKLKSYEEKATRLETIDPAFEAVAKYFGTRDPQVIQQAIAETERQQQEALLNQELQAQWNVNAVQFGEEAANALQEVQRQQLQTQAALNQVHQSTRNYEVERTISTLSDVVKDPEAIKLVNQMVKSSPTEYLPTLVSQIKGIASAIEIKTRAEYASRKTEDARRPAPVTSGGRPPGAPGKANEQANQPHSWSGWLVDQMNGNGSA